MFARSNIRRVLAIAAALSAATVTLSPAGSAGGASVAAQALTASCPASLVVGGHDYHGLALVKCNFKGLDLTNANFRGATLTAVVFIRANLSGADFSGATIADSQNPAFPTDFSFATLTDAKFIKTVFNGPTYLTYSTLTCANFSQTNINNGNAIFGDSPYDTHYYYVRSDFEDSKRLIEQISKMTRYYYPTTGKKSINYAKFPEP